MINKIKEVCKKYEEIISYLKWCGKEVTDSIEIVIAQEKDSELNIKDADSDVLFESEICVCGIAEVLDMTVSAVSHQLRLLKAAGLVKFRRLGKECYYSLADDHVKTIIAMGKEHIEE